MVSKPLGYTTISAERQRATSRWNVHGVHLTIVWRQVVGSEPDLRFLVYDHVYSSTGTQLRTEEKFYDGLDRQRYEELNRVLGIWDVQIVTYDSLGRKTEATIPYSSSSNGYHVYSYDVGNRMNGGRSL